MSDDFNYDSNDPQLDDNGLIYEDDEYEGSSSQDLMDLIRRARSEDDDEEEDDDDDDSSSSNSKKKKDEQSSDNAKDKPQKGEGGRYGDKTSPTDKLKTGGKGGTSKPTTPGGSGGSDWFSKMLNKGGGGANNMLGKAGSKLGGSAAKAGAKAGAAGAKAGGSAMVKALAAIGPWGIIIILAIIIVTVAIIAIVAFFQKTSDPDNMSTNKFVTSEHFYGTRSVYIDADALTNELQLSYKQYVIDVVENFEETNPNIDITITLPQLNEGEKLTNETEIDQHIGNLSLGIANIVATGSSSYSGVDFSTLYPQIAYFGLSTEQNTLVTDFIRNYIVDNTLYSTQDDGVNVGDLINATIADDVDLQYILNRAEKVMIKDEIATESGLQGIEIRQYIASIYMPNKDIVITGASYIVSSKNEVFNADSKLIEENNGSEVIHKEKNTTDNRDIISGFSLKQVNVKKFTSIDENNVEAFSSGLSLFAALRLSAGYKSYFTLNDDGIYTWKPTSESLYYLTFNADSPFIFSDFNLNIK